MPRSLGAVDSFLAERFGGLCNYRDHTDTVGTAQVMVASNDGERVGLIFMNLGATTIYLKPGTGVLATAGIRLGATGGGLSVNVVEDAVLPAVDWWALGSAGGGTLYVLEIRREHVIPSGGG